MTKSEISEKLASYRRIPGVMVFTFNSNHPMPQGAKNFPDHVIISKNGNVIFIEVKLGKDELKPGQAYLQEILLLAGVKNPMLHYRIISTEQELAIVCTMLDKLLTGRGSL